MPIGGLQLILLLRGEEKACFYGTNVFDAPDIRPSSTGCATLSFAPLYGVIVGISEQFRNAMAHRPLLV